MYFGYAIGGFYYSFSDGEFGKFLGFLNLERVEVEAYLVYALIYVNFCYLSTCLGYKIFLRGSNFFEINFNSNIAQYLSYNGGWVISLMIAIGLGYWIWVSYTIAGGILNALILFQLFPHLAADHKISIAPYLLYYAGINIWLIKLIVKRLDINFIFIIFSIIGFIISVSTARISISVTYVFAQLYLIYMVRPASRLLIHKLFIIIICVGFGLYFLREVSNYLFLNNGGIEGLNLNIFNGVIGDGNIADLQQLVIIFKTYKLDQLLFGSSYLDWLNNSLTGILDLKPTSVGLRIANLYVPDSSGAPTPGSVGEAFVNFHIFGLIFMFAFGAGMAFLNRVICRRNSVISYFVYSCFLTSFIFLYPKVDSTVIVNFFWNAFPTILILFTLYQISKLFRSKKFSKT